MGLEQEVDTILELDAKVLKIENERKADIKTLTEKIIKHEGSTGDPIRDFVIATHHDISKEAEQPYRALEEMLKGKEGEQVLVVNEEIKNDYGNGSSRYINVESTLRLSTLTSDKVRFEIGNVEEHILDFSLSHGRDNFTGPRIILPTERYAEKCDERALPYDWSLADGEIQIPNIEFHSFDIDGEKTMSEGMDFEHENGIRSSRKLLIRVGRKNVADYFKSNRSLYRDDFSYVKALRLLGIENQAPKKFVIGYNKEIKEEKGNILTKLKELVHEEERLKDSKETQTKWPVTREIKSNLERAVKLDMHQKKLIINGEIPGESFNARTFIRTLCKQYEVNYSRN